MVTGNLLSRVTPVRVKGLLSRLRFVAYSPYLRWGLLAATLLAYSFRVVFSDPRLFPASGDQSIDLLDARTMLSDPGRTHGWFSPNADAHQPGPLPYVALNAIAWPLARLLSVSPYWAATFLTHLFILAASLTSVLLLRRSYGVGAAWALSAILVLSLNNLGNLAFPAATLFGPLPVTWLSLTVAAGLASLLRRRDAVTAAATILTGGLLAQSHYLAAPFGLIATMYAGWVCRREIISQRPWLALASFALGWGHLVVRFGTDPSQLLDAMRAGNRNLRMDGRTFGGVTDALANNWPFVSRIFGHESSPVKAVLALGLAAVPLIVLLRLKRFERLGRPEIFLLVGVSVAAAVTISRSFEAHHSLWISGVITVMLAVSIRRPDVGRVAFLLSATIAISVINPDAKAWGSPSAPLSVGVSERLASTPLRATVYGLKMGQGSPVYEILYQLVADGADICIDTTGIDKFDLSSQGELLPSFACDGEALNDRNHLIVVEDPDQSSPMRLGEYNLVARVDNRFVLQCERLGRAALAVENTACGNEAWISEQSPVALYLRMIGSGDNSSRILPALSGVLQSIMSTP
jgi:hypothetical protein